MCDTCSVALGKRGYVTYCGSLVQQNVWVTGPGGLAYPGMVNIAGETYPPKRSKWEKVSVPPGAVTYDPDLAKYSSLAFGDLPKRRVPFAPTQLSGVSAVAKPRWTHTLCGIACSGMRPMVSANNPYVKAKALLGRVFLERPVGPWGSGPVDGIWEWAEKFIPELVGDLSAPRMSDEDWLASMPSRRRRALRRAQQVYATTGWKRAFAKFKAFVKTELLPGFSKGPYDEPYRMTEMLDRLIQGPNDVGHVIAGPYLKPLVAKLKEAWGHDSALFYGSACPEKLHAWLQRYVVGEALYFWSDFSMFDCTHTDETWAFMEKLYWQSGIKDSDFWAVMRAWRRPAGTIGPFRYQASTMNASGRDDTALANGVLNGFATFLSACASYLEKPLAQLTVDDVRECRKFITLSVCGDDTLGRVPIGTDRQSFERLMNYNLRLFGFVPKLCTSYRLEDCVYLGMRPYPTASGWLWGKTIGRATYKLGWVIKKGDNDLMATMTGVADMHVKCSRHVPVLYDLAAKIVELRKGAKRNPPEVDLNRPWEWININQQVDYDETTIASVARAYTTRSLPGNVRDPDVDVYVTSRDVLDLIEHIRAIKSLPCVVDHWLWRRMVTTDDL